MEFDLPEQTKALKALVRQLVETYQMPLEQKLLRGETISPDDLTPGRAAAKRPAFGAWACQRNMAAPTSPPSTMWSLPKKTNGAWCRWLSAGGRRDSSFV